MTQPSLVRQLGVVSASALVVSNMIGTGIFTSTGFQAGQLGSPGVVLTIWVAGAILALAGALCYSELGVNFPRSGGEYVYLSEAWGPSWGFINGWVSFFAGFSAPISAAALAIAAYLAHFLPGLSPESQMGPTLTLGFLTIRLGGAQLFACAIVLLFTLLNVLGIEQVAKLQNLLTGTKLLVLALFLILGFAVGDGDWSHFSQAAKRTSEYSLPAQFAVSLVFLYLSYSGWNAAVYVAEEIRNPERTLPIALIAGTTLVAVFYVALNVLFIYANPLEEMKGVLAVGSLAASALFGAGAAGFFSAAMAASLLATVNVMCMVGPRVYYAMAQNHAFFPAAARLHPRWQSPYWAVLAQGACCCLLIVTGTFENLVYYIGFTLNLFAAFSVVALLKFRRRPAWKRLWWVSFAYPLIPGLFVAINLWVFGYFAFLQRAVALWSLLTIVGGALVFQLYRSRETPKSRET